MKHIVLPVLAAALIGCAHHPTPSAPAADKVHGPEVIKADGGRPDPNEILVPFDPDDPRGPIYFDYDIATLRDTAQAAALAAYLQVHPGRVLLKGYTSEEGADEYNLALGARRAQTVRSYLVAYGIAENRIACISYGEENPVTHDPAEFWKNRRVEFTLEAPK